MNLRDEPDGEERGEADLNGGEGGWKRLRNEQERERTVDMEMAWGRRSDGDGYYSRSRW